MQKPKLNKQQAIKKATTSLDKIDTKHIKGESHYRFSFYYLSQNDIFNFGSNMTKPVEIDNSYWTDLLSMLAYGEQVKVTTFDRDVKMHEYDWDNSPHFSRPKQHESEKIMQFRINKQSRVIGFKDSVSLSTDKDGTLIMFNILWIDFHHNHCDSDGYGSLTSAIPVQSLFERQQNEIDTLTLRISAQDAELDEKNMELDLVYKENEELRDKYKLLQQSLSDTKEISPASSFFT